MTRSKKTHMTTRNASAHPWRKVVSTAEHITAARSLTLECGHLLHRSKSRAVPERVRCTMCRPGSKLPESTGLPLTMTGEKRDDALPLAAAVDRLDARRDPLDDKRWVYVAEDTKSTWSVTTEAMVELGAMPDTEDACHEWASSDNTAIERPNSRRW